MDDDDDDDDDDDEKDKEDKDVTGDPAIEVYNTSPYNFGKTYLPFCCSRAAT